MPRSGIDKEQLIAQGFSVFSWEVTDELWQLRQMVEQLFPFGPEWHLHQRPMETHLLEVEKLALAVGQSGVVERLIRKNLSLFSEVLGEEIDMQSQPYIRVSRPNIEGDMIGWHRDTFYGNAPLEMNLWFPILPLASGAGLMMVPGSHQEPSENVCDFQETDPFRRSVVRGSVAHRMGYLYAPKIDDSIARLDPSRILVLTPEWGQAVFFYASTIHRAKNASNETRITADIRLKSRSTATSTKQGYYRQLEVRE